MQPILVATDFSPRSDRALRRAQLWARQRGAPLALLHVAPHAHALPAARALLAAAARTLREVDGIDATPHVAQGAPHTAIVATAKALDAQLIVLGPHRRRWTDLVRAGTAERVVRDAPMPVLVARLPPCAPHARALLALDFDAASTRAARTARRLGLFAHMPVSAVHVLDAAARDPVQAPLARQLAIDADERRAWREARLRLHRVVDGLGLRFERARLVAPGGSIAQSLLQCVAQEGAPLLVAGTRRRDRLGFDALLAGSVAQQLLRAARCDVLIVPEVAPALQSFASAAARN